MEHKLKDRRGNFTLVSEMTGKEPMMNPISWKLVNDWDDGYHLSDNTIIGNGDKITLIKVFGNEIIEAFRLIPLVLDKDIL